MRANKLSAKSTPQANAAGASSNWLGVSAGFLGVSIDAFNFFVVVFILGELSTTFGVSKAAIVFSLTATLALRPVGAFFFGILADRYGRRVLLMADIISFTVFQVLCGLAPSYATFLVLRALFGVAMGGEWGVGTSLAMETVPNRWRGILSGVLQSGYPVGYLLAAVAARIVLPVWGWRAMFLAGAVPGLLTLYICFIMPEPEAWRVNRPQNTAAILRAVGAHAKEFAYLVLLMALMIFSAHGAQDLYPDFLKSVHHVSPGSVEMIAILYNCGAILGSIIFGALSQRIGRRLGMDLALGFSVLCVPLWAFGHSVAMLALGAFLMQVGVQGAWGVVPAHLIELAPSAARSLLPGMALQLGILFASPTNTIEFALRNYVGYPWAIGSFELLFILSTIIVVSLGRERHGRDFMKAE